MVNTLLLRERDTFTFPQLFAVAATLKSILSTIMLLWHSFLIIIILITIIIMQNFTPIGGTVAEISRNAY